MEVISNFYAAFSFPLYVFANYKQHKIRGWEAHPNVPAKQDFWQYDGILGERMDIGIMGCKGSQNLRGK